MGLESLFGVNKSWFDELMDLAYQDWVYEVEETSDEELWMNW